MSSSTPPNAAVLYAHAALMLLAWGALLPWGVGLARVRSPLHRYVQATACGLVALGFVFALVSEGSGGGGEAAPTPLSVTTSARPAGNVTASPAKRHTHDDAVPGGGEATAHAYAHSVLGLCMLVLLAAQVVLGAARARTSARGAGDALLNALRAVHHVTGYALLAVAWPLQALLGASALLAVTPAGRGRALCDAALSGVDQCVGHFGVAAALCVAALGYAALRRVRARAPDGTPLYRAHELEHAVLCAAGACTALYSLYSEYPYAGGAAHVHHLALGLLVAACGAAGVARVRRDERARTQWLHPAVRHGLALVVCAVAAGALLASAGHAQHNAYGDAMHAAFALTLLAAAAARALLWLRALCALLLYAALVFAASQRGFAQLFTEAGGSADDGGPPSAQRVVASVLAVLALVACGVLAAAHGWYRAYGARVLARAGNGAVTVTLVPASPARD